MDLTNLPWRSIAGSVAPFAPKLGSVLGSAFGPLGGIAGSIIGNAIAGAFGVPATPEAVGKAIAQDPKAAERLEQLEKEHANALIAQAQIAVERAKQEGETNRTNIEEVNQTLRAELGQVHWWHWRHLSGYVMPAFGLEILLLTPLVLMGKITAPDMVAIIGALMPVTAIYAALQGVILNDTSALKTTAITGQATPGIISTAINAVTGKKK